MCETVVPCSVETTEMAVNVLFPFDHACDFHTDAGSWIPLSDQQPREALDCIGRIYIYVTAAVPSLWSCNVEIDFRPHSWFCLSNHKGETANGHFRPLPVIPCFSLYCKAQWVQKWMSPPPLFIHEPFTGNTRLSLKTCYHALIKGEADDGVAHRSPRAYPV